MAESALAKERSEGASARVMRVLVDALEPFVSRSDAQSIVGSALAVARVSVPPPVGPELRRFVEGHLLDAIESALGSEVADAFEESIDAVMRAAAMELESAPVPRRSDLGRLVLVATTVPARAEALAQALSRHANVEMIMDAGALAPILWARLAMVIVVDCASCPIPLSMLEEMAAAASSQTRVLLWGAPRSMEGVFTDAERGTWLSCAAAATPAHVAQLALALSTG